MANPAEAIYEIEGPNDNAKLSPLRQRNPISNYMLDITQGKTFYTALWGSPKATAEIDTPAQLDVADIFNNGIFSMVVDFPLVAELLGSLTYSWETSERNIYYKRAWDRIDGTTSRE